jgi:hypothetical protein
VRAIGANKDFALIAFEMNSMGAHYNPVSTSIVNSESKNALDSSYNATYAGLYATYNTTCLRGNETCGFCTRIQQQIEAKNGTFDAGYGDMSVEGKLKIMEDSVHVTPTPVKSGKMVSPVTAATVTVNMRVSIRGYS